MESYASLLERLDMQNKYSEPMPWIGMYIALASLFCIIAMAADLLHGIRKRKLWFPCKYFTMNAASLTVIAVAMKLPMDLNNPMPGYVDQGAKLGSLPFLCTMIVNLSSSQASMNNKELVTNIIALGVLVITLVVNVCIQIKTGVVYNYYGVSLVAIAYVAMILMLLIIQTCSALAIIKSKQLLESKYQEGRETALKDMKLQHPGKLTTEKLKQHVKNHWIMAQTSNPQFITACSATTSASGVICVLSVVIHIFIMLATTKGGLRDYQSDYKWSIPVICITQFIGAVLGTIVPLSRCFATLSFKLSIKWIWNHIKVFKVESYWTQKLRDWKHSSIPFSISSRKSKIIFQLFKILILRKTVVVACKMIAMILVLFVLCVFYCKRCHKWIKAMFGVSGIVLVTNSEHPEINNDHRRYVLQLQDDIELAERTLDGIKKSMNRLIQKAEKQQPIKLIKLLEGSTNFEGVGKYDNHVVPPLSEEAYLDCWSLPLVTLTSIAISLPNIQNNIADRLLCSVSEGLTYVRLMEESLNATDEYLSIQKAAKFLWLQVEVYHEWLGNNLHNFPPRVNTVGQILHWFIQKQSH